MELHLFHLQNGGNKTSLWWGAASCSMQVLFLRWWWKSLSRVQLFVTLWTAAWWALLFIMELSRQEFPDQESNPLPPAVEAQSPNHRTTREFPKINTFTGGNKTPWKRIFRSVGITLQSAFAFNFTWSSQPFEVCGSISSSTDGERSSGKLIKRLR